MAKRKIKRRTLAQNLALGESSGLIDIARIAPEIAYIFRHGLVQDAAYNSVLKKDRQTLHASVGEALERLYPDRADEMAATLAYHFNRAGNRDRALRYFDRATEVAMTGYANSEAESLCREALTLAELEHDKASLYSRLGETLYRQSRFEDAITTWGKAIELYYLLGNSNSMCYLYARSGRARDIAGDTPGALTLCLAALDSVKRKARTPGLAALLSETGRAYYFNGKKDDARLFVERALRIASACGAAEIEADALINYALLLPDPHESRTVLEQAVDIAETGNFLRIALRAHGELAFNLQRLGTVSEWVEHNARRVELTQRIGSPSDIVNQIGFQIWLLCILGKLDAADMLLETYRSLFHNLPNREGLRPYFYFIQGDLAYRYGDWKSAEGYFRSSVAEAQAQNEHTMFESTTDWLGMALNEQGEWDQSISILEDRMRFRTWEAVASVGFLHLSIAYLRLKRLPDARRALNEEYALLKVSPNYMVQNKTLVAEGLFAAAEGQRDDADQLFARSVEALNAVEYRWDCAWAMWKWGEAMRTLDGEDDPHACDLLDQAAAEFEAMGAPRIAAQIRQEHAPTG